MTAGTTDGAQELRAEGSAVLVVDDDPRILQTIRWALEDEGLAVTEASDARQALATVDAARPGMVVLDYGLPDQNGGVLAAALRSRLSQPERPAPLILLITADGRAAEKAQLAGAFAYLHKPFDVDELVRLVREGLEGPDRS